MARRKKQNEEDISNENNGNDSDDSFGLPEIEYEPIRRDEPTESTSASSGDNEPQPQQAENSYTGFGQDQQEEPVSEEPYRYTPYQEESSIWPKVLGILFVIVLALGATWYFVIYQPKQKERMAAEQAEAAAREAARKAKEEEENRLRLQRQAAEQRRLDSLAAIPKEGSIETLSERTGRYYVIITSALDRDLLMDYAKKLSNEGVSTKIIPPFGKHKVSRMAVSEGDTFDAAQTKANELKAQYGDGVWVLKY